MGPTPLQSFHLTPDEIALRHSLDGLSQADEANLERIRFVLREHSTSIVDAFNDHLLHGSPRLRRSSSGSGTNA